MVDGQGPVNRRSAVRDVLGNSNVVRAEVSLAAGIIGQVAWLASMLIVMFDRIGPVGPGIFVIVRQLAGAASAPFYAALASRFRRERLLAAATAARGTAVALAIPLLEFHGPTAFVILVIALEGVTQSAPTALHDALLPWLADSPGQLVTANSLSSLIETAGRLVGAGMAAVGMWLSGPTVVLMTVVLLAAVGSWLLAAITGINTRVGDRRSRVAKDLVGGAGVLRRSPDARAVVAIMAVTAALTGGAQSVAPSIATVLLHTDSAMTPVLIGAVGLGGLMGGITSLSLARRRSMSVPLILGLASCAMASFAIAASSSLILTLLLLIGFGVGIAYQVVCGRTLLQRSASGRSLDLLVGVHAFIAVSVVGVAGLCAAALTAAIGVRQALVVAGGVVLLAVAYALWRVPRLQRVSGATRDELDAIQRVRAFRQLSVAATDQLASVLVAMPCAVDDVVVRQGDFGQCMFLVGSGQFGVTVDGHPLPTMGGGDHFGEIALLFDARRTATVRCLQAGTIWRLERDDFLRAITGNSATEATITAIARERLARGGEIRSNGGAAG
jgi:hypothetical protein